MAPTVAACSATVCKAKLVLILRVIRCFKRDILGYTLFIKRDLHQLRHTLLSEDKPYYDNVEQIVVSKKQQHLSPQDFTLIYHTG